MGYPRTSMVSALNPRPRDCHKFRDLQFQGLGSCLRRHMLTLLDDLVRKLLQQLPWMVPQLRICPPASAVCYAFREQSWGGLSAERGNQCHPNLHPMHTHASGVGWAAER